MLGTMTQLRELALPSCYNLTGANLAAAVRGLTRLTSLTLTALPLCGEHVASMVACLLSLSNLQVSQLHLHIMYTLSVCTPGLGQTHTQVSWSVPLSDATGTAGYWGQS